VPVDIESDGPSLDGRRHEVLGLAAPAEHGSDARHELTAGVGLGDVVVCSQLQSDDLVHLAVLGGQHDHRHG
jgi:hypothetical protein